VDEVVAAFDVTVERYGGLFRTRARDNGPVARRYLSGLMQAEDRTFETMATVVEHGCAQRFQHFISNSPWDHEPVVARIPADADRLLGATVRSRSSVC
jgi:SRSO17 transposase